MKQIYKILKDWKEESKAKGVIQFKYDHRNGELIIYTSHPGYLIGRAGCYSYKYESIFKEKISSFKNLKFVETDYYFVN